MVFKIPEGWHHAWDEETKCLFCNGKTITISQSCGEMNQYEIRCVDCGALISSHYED